jgi:glycosyltransferase involved in cell wall biosynthesis
MPPELGLPVHYTGLLHDNISLRLLYSAADALVVPSRQDNLPNTGVEALTCGTPVIAFNTCGLPDIVSHKETGYLTEPFDVEDLATGIKWVFADAERYKVLRRAAREKAVKYFDQNVIAKQYQNVYQQVLTQ